MSDILITGAAGFVGYHLSRRLSAAYSLELIDAFQTDNHASKMRAEQLRSVKKINILSPFLDQMEHKPKIIIHLAAETGISGSSSNAELYFNTNVSGTLNVMEQCRENGVKYLIYASSSSVYSMGQEITSENSDTNHPLSFYGTTKKMSELMIENYCMQYGLIAIGLRFFTVYGSWTRPDMAAYKFMSAINKSEAVNLYNNGEVYRDFTHVSDIVNSIELIIPKIGKLKAGTHEIFNIGMGRPISIKEYASKIAKSLNKELKVNNKKLPDDELAITHSDTSKLFQFINYKPKCHLEDGIREMTEWYKTERYDQ